MTPPPPSSIVNSVFDVEMAYKWSLFRDCELYYRNVRAELRVPVCRTRLSSWCIKTTGKLTILFYYWLQAKFEMSHIKAFT